MDSQHAALAVKTRDNGHIRDTFERLTVELPANDRFGEYRNLSPRNATRWGSDHALLLSYHALRDAVDRLLALPLSLGNLRLSEEEWNLSTNLRDMLQVGLSIMNLLLRFDKVWASQSEN